VRHIARTGDYSKELQSNLGSDISPYASTDDTTSSLGLWDVQGKSNNPIIIIQKFSKQLELAFVRETIHLIKEDAQLLHIDPAG